MRDKRLAGFKRDYFDTIVIDEAHHCISDSYQKVLGYFQNAKVLGVTATPDRGDMKDLGTLKILPMNIPFQKRYGKDIYRPSKH